MKVASGIKAGPEGCDRSLTFKGGAVTAHSMMCAQGPGVRRAGPHRFLFR